MPPYIAVPAYIDMSQLWGAQAAEQLGVLSQLSQVKDQIDKQQMESAVSKTIVLLTIEIL